MFGEMRSLNSSWLLGARYDDQTQELTVEFRDGHTETKSGVPQAVADGLFAAGSPGAYYRRHIMGSY